MILTDLNCKVYDYIRDYIRLNDFSPSIREIADNVYISHEEARRQLKTLQEARLITFNPGVHRSIRLNG
jgi:SOS-response transcriptional repressor LexA